MAVSKAAKVSLWEEAVWLLEACRVGVAGEDGVETSPLLWGAGFTFHASRGCSRPKVDYCRVHSRSVCWVVCESAFASLRQVSSWPHQARS